jgi:hypothetical protein
MLNVINRWGGYSYMSRLADRFGSNQSKSPFLYNVRLYSNALLPPIHPSIPGLVCTYKHVDIYIWCMYTMVFFLRYLRCQRKVRGGRETYILLLFFILPLSLSFSLPVGRIISRRVCISCIRIFINVYTRWCLYSPRPVLIFFSGKIHTQRDKGKDRDL